MTRALEMAVRHAVGPDLVTVGPMRRQPLRYDAFLAGRGLSRLSGVAGTPAGPRSWSMVEKVTEGPAVASPYLYDNARREVHAYRSGLLEDLAPGVGAPRLHGSEEGGDGRLTLWLQDLAGLGATRSPSDVLAAARLLGRLAGRWMDGVPGDGWLFRGWIDRHRQPHAIGPALERLGNLRQPAAVEERVGWTVADAIALIELQAALPALLGSLPTTLCHHDAVAANVFMRRTGNDAEIILIDWEMIGPGPIGADLASLLFSSARRGDISARALPGLVSPAAAAYADGLRDVGAEVEQAAISIGFDAAIALRWTLLRDVSVAIDEEKATFRGSAPHESPSKALDQLVVLSRVLFQSAADIRRLTG